jgi:hypothetical protein
MDIGETNRGSRNDCHPSTIKCPPEELAVISPFSSSALVAFFVGQIFSTLFSLLFQYTSSFIFAGSLFCSCSPLLVPVKSVCLRPQLLRFFCPLLLFAIPIVSRAFNTLSGLNQ